MNLFKSIFLISLLTFGSCSKWDNDPCKHSRGEKGKITLPLSKFHHLEINHHLPVTLIYSDSPKIIIYGPTGSLKFISSEVQNDTLRLKNLNRCSWLRNYDTPLSLEIYTPSLVSILQKGSADVLISGTFPTPKLKFYSDYYSGNFTVENLITDSLLAWVNSLGSARFQLNGKSDYAYLFIRGSSEIVASNLETETAHLVSYSNGNIFIKAPKTLLLGEIRYNGNLEVSSRPPQEKIVITGKGKYLHP